MQENQKPSEGIATDEVAQTPHAPETSEVEKASEVETKEEQGNQIDAGEGANLSDDSDKVAEGAQPSDVDAVL